MQELKMQDQREEKRKANIKPYWLEERERILKLCEAIKEKVEYNANEWWEAAKIYSKEIEERCEFIERMKNHEGGRNGR